MDHTVGAGDGEGRERVTLSHTIVYLDGEESSALIIWRWSARLPGGRIGSTPNESTSGASGKRGATSSGGRIATTRPHSILSVGWWPSQSVWTEGISKAGTLILKLGRSWKPGISWSPYT